MKEIKTNVMRILDKEKVEYTVATLMNQNPDYVFKTLVTKGMGRDYYVFVVPVDHELDLKKCAKSVGEKSVEMIPVKDITKVTGYVRGGCSPLGMKKQFKTTFHITAESIPKIIVSAGKIGYQIDLKPEDLLTSEKDAKWPSLKELKETDLFSNLK